MRVNFKKTKMMLSSETTGKATMKGKFPSAVCRKGVGSNFTLCQFCRCSVHKRCSSIRGKLREDGKFPCQACVNQQT